MNEHTARQVLLIQAFETDAPDGPLWTPEDRGWATRVAADSVGPAAPADAYLAERAAHAMQRLLPREPTLARWLSKPCWRWTWLLLAIAVGVAVGLAADSIGSAQRINLLAPPLWTVVLWNGVVYALLLSGSVSRSMHRTAPRPGALHRAVQRLIERNAPSAGRSPSGHTRATFQAHARAWASHSAPLLSARAAAVLHAAAAALALGLIAGMYLRGLVLDYRVGWQSTFLDAAAVHAGLSALLGPVAALSGLPLPDVSAVEALRVAPGAASGIGAADNGAATWIHLYALTLALLVVLPRSLLVAWSLLRADRLARRFPLPLDSAYFQRLIRQQQGAHARVQVLPYAQAPAAASTLGLRNVLAATFGDAVQLDVLPTTAYGSEVDASPAPKGTTASIALFDLAATPEADSQGRYLRGLATRGAELGATPLVMLVDESSFKRRFAGSAERVAQRSAAWQQLAASLGTVAVLIDLERPDLPAAGRALQSALDRPVRADATA